MGLAFHAPSRPTKNWSIAFFTYSHQRYEPTLFASGEPFGTPEEGLDVGAVYLAG